VRKRVKAHAATLFFAALLLAVPAAAFGETVFTPVDVYLDSGERSLAAFQFEFLFDGEAATIVGIEGGEGLFRDAPYYDPAGMERGRIVIAAFTTDARPPRGRVRVARIHLMVDGELRRPLEARLIVAAGRLEEKYDAPIDIVIEPGGDHE
jgi:hypothetical protein